MSLVRPSPTRIISTDPASGDGILQQLHHILFDDTRTIESLGPANQQAFGQTKLLQRKRKGESQRQTFFVHIVLLKKKNKNKKGVKIRYTHFVYDFVFDLYLHKVGQTLGNVIEQLIARAEHDALWHGVDLRLHFEFMFALEMDNEHTEVGAAQIECEEFAAFYRQHSRIKKTPNQHNVNVRLLT